jgi:biopolymer transport protein ExbD
MSKNSRIVALFLTCALLAGCDKQTGSTASGGSTTPPTASFGPTDLKLSVSDVSVRTKFQVYVGGGVNIVPPQPFDGGDGVPAIQIGSSGGKSLIFMAGELQSDDAKSKFIKVSCTITNSATETRVFKIGDVTMTVDGAKADGFAGVGYDDRVCSMGEDDRKTVQNIRVELPPNGTRHVTYIFQLAAPDSKKADLSFQNRTPLSFDIPSDSTPPPPTLVINIRKNGDTLISGKRYSEPDLKLRVRQAIAAERIQTVIIREDEEAMDKDSSAVIRICKEAGLNDVKLVCLKEPK